jgi:hypothetical protein
MSTLIITINNRKIVIMPSTIPRPIETSESSSCSDKTLPIILSAIPRPILNAVESSLFCPFKNLTGYQHI